MVMMRGKTLWVPPILNFHFLQLLSSPLKILSNTQIVVSNPDSDPFISPPPASKNAYFEDFFSGLTRSLQSIIPWRPGTQAQLPVSPLNRRSDAGCSLPLFRPYVAKVPWHGGPRAFLSQLFPRYGHYCGPNWSSGKDQGSMLWDRRPIDWLDFCCYCHDIGYDTHDQAKLLKADLAFLECLEKPRIATKGGAQAALLYRAMCIAGLRSILIPYRTQLVKLQSGPSFAVMFGNVISKLASSGRMGTDSQKQRL
ncbi:uncharacterized protein [Typha latifolia]|uniref:uncharacterized protein n=1 Tax=Typha latifolia TaxID=4733 RepID=UPI003C2B657A